MRTDAAGLAALLLLSGCFREPEAPPAAAEKPLPAVSEPAPARVEPPTKAVEPPPAKIEPLPPKVEPPPVRVEAPPATTEPPPVVPAVPGVPKSGYVHKPLPIDPKDPVAAGLRKGLEFYAGKPFRHGNWPKGGGWCGDYSADFRKGSGENVTVPMDTIRIQPIATPDIATVFLMAWMRFGERKWLDVASAAGETLVAGQTRNGGWGYEICLAADGPRNVHVGGGGKTEWGASGPPAGSQTNVYDDGCTYASAEFLYKLWWVTGDPRPYLAWRRAMDGIVASQRKDGGFPQAFPSGGFHAATTFNDGVMRNSCYDLFRAWRRTGDKKYRDAFCKAADYLVAAQSPLGGWGAVIGEGYKPIQARSFEPPGLGPDATRDAIRILLSAHEATGETKYLEPVSKAAEWLRKSQTRPGVWHRYYDPSSGRPVGGGKGGYAWDGAWGTEGIALAEAAKGRGPQAPLAVPAGGDPSFDLHWVRGSGGKYKTAPEEIVRAQEEDGSWPTRRKIDSRRFHSYAHQLFAALDAKYAPKEADAPAPPAPAEEEPEPKGE